MAICTVSVEELERSIQTRLRNRAASPTVIWASGDEELELMPLGAALMLTAGWLAITVPVSARLRGARVLNETLGVVFYLGTSSHGAGLGASTTIARAADQALADRWGPVVQRIVWEAVESALDSHVRSAGPGARLRGFHGGDREIIVDVEV